MRVTSIVLCFSLLALTSGTLMARGLIVQSQSSISTQNNTDANVTANGVIGEVKAIDVNSGQLIVKTDAGSIVTVALKEKTSYLRLAPGEKTLANATKITLAEVGEGDRVWARGKVSDDHRSLPAVALVIMNKADIARKQEQERAEWRRRGIFGVITALKVENKEITISSRSMAGTQSVIIPVTDKVELRRYAPDSIKFNDAKASEFGEFQVGDQLRALGERSSDGTKFIPEKIVSGTFRVVAGTVSAVDQATGEITISELEKKQPLAIVVKHDAVLRKFPAAGEIGAMQMFRGAAGTGPGASSQGQTGGQGRNERGDGAAPLGGGPRGGGNIQDFLERLPKISLADIKTGDTIIVSSTKGADPARLTAISLVSGADTLLNMIAARQQQVQGQTVTNPAAGLGAGIQFGIGLP
jgi:hypothetical protein